MVTDHSETEQKLAHINELISGPVAHAEAIEALQEYLYDESAEVRAAAVDAIWDFPDPRLIDRLIEIANADLDAETRRRALIALGRYVYEGEQEFGQTAEDTEEEGERLRLDEEQQLSREDFERVCTFLETCYRDPQRPEDERRVALEALSFRSDESVLEMIAEAYRQPSRQMKISALFAMGRNGDARWSPIVLRELNNTDRAIRLEAIRAAGEMGLVEAGKTLWHFTYDPDPEIRKEAIWALGQTGWDQGYDRLEELSYDPDPEIREIAEEALEEWFFFNKLNYGDWGAEEDDDNELWTDEEWDEDL